jgi:hypothetical protein
MFFCRYCSKECQTQHWKAHKAACKQLAAERADTGDVQGLLHEAVGNLAAAQASVAAAADAVAAGQLQYQQGASSVLFWECAAKVNDGLEVSMDCLQKQMAREGLVASSLKIVAPCVGLVLATARLLGVLKDTVAAIWAKSDAGWQQVWQAVDDADAAVHKAMRFAAFAYKAAAA